MVEGLLLVGRSTAFALAVPRTRDVQDAILKGSRITKVRRPRAPIERWAAHGGRSPRSASRAHRGVFDRTAPLRRSRRTLSSIAGWRGREREIRAHLAGSHIFVADQRRIWRGAGVVGAQMTLWQTRSLRRLQGSAQRDVRVIQSRMYLGVHDENVRIAVAARAGGSTLELSRFFHHQICHAFHTAGRRARPLARRTIGEPLSLGDLSKDGRSSPLD
jgi:hypothetical protein